VNFDIDPRRGQAELRAAGDARYCHKEDGATIAP